MGVHVQLFEALGVAANPDVHLMKCALDLEAKENSKAIGMIDFDVLVLYHIV